MKIACVNMGKSDLLQYLPKDIAHVVLDTPADLRYTDEQLHEIAQCDGIFATGTGHVTEQLLQAGKRLKIVQKNGAGIDRIDIAAATRHGIVCCNSGNMNSNRVADYSMMLVLTLFRNYLTAVNLLKAGDWGAARAEGQKALEIEGKTLGIVGFGNIGTRLGKRAHAFDMKVIFNDVNPNANADIARQIDARWVEKEELYRTADVISVNAPLNDTTRAMISHLELAMMKQSAYLICTARGNIIDEAALRKALDEGKLAGASIDVFSTEPITPDNPLLGARNANLSPHIAASGREGMRRQVIDSIENIRRYVMDGARPNNVLNPEVLAGTEKPAR